MIEDGPMTAAGDVRYYEVLWPISFKFDKRPRQGDSWREHLLCIQWQAWYAGFIWGSPDGVQEVLTSRVLRVGPFRFIFGPDPDSKTEDEDDE